MNSDVRNIDKMILKEKAINYFKENGIPKIVENSLNELFKNSPKDAYGFLSKYFENLCPIPQITKIIAYETIGDFGLSTISIKIYSIFRIEETEIVNISVPNNMKIKFGENFTFDNVKTYEDVIKETVQFINDDLVNLFLGVDPRLHEFMEKTLKDSAADRQEKWEDEMNQMKQNELNKEETKTEDSKTKATSGKSNKKLPTITIIPDDPPELICPDLKAHFALSIALAEMASVIKKQNLYETTISRLNIESMALEERTALPIIPIFCNGKGLPGKCQMIRKCYLVPNGIYDHPTQVLNDLRLASSKIYFNIQSKFPLTLTNDHGELVPAFDRPEQYVEVILEVLKELVLEEKIKLVIEIGAMPIFDFTKGKYEVMIGQLKSSEEMVALLKELVDKYPAIVGLVNPLRKQDVEQWNSLARAVGDRCFIIGRAPQVFPRMQKVAENPQFMEEFPLRVSAVGVEIDGYSTHGDYVTGARHLAGADRKLCIWLDDLCGQTWLVDLACGLLPYLIVMPGFRCASGATKIERWLDLAKLQQIASSPGLVFPVLFEVEEEAETEVTEQESTPVLAK